MSSGNNESKLSSGVVIGIVFGSVGLLLFIVVGVGYYIKCIRKRTIGQKENEVSLAGGMKETDEYGAIDHGHAHLSTSDAHNVEN